MTSFGKFLAMSCIFLLTACTNLHLKEKDGRYVGVSVTDSVAIISQESNAYHIDELNLPKYNETLMSFEFE
jgi:hypothetical protein